jgi:response regulator RpfG family c-di-GMP phosphodiesterase
MAAAVVTDVVQESTILIVDDESNILSSLQRLFRPLGYRIFTATSAQEALDILQGEAVDLIISDMRMPQMSGAEFFEQVMQRWPDTVRILLTGYADITSTVAAINKGGIYKYISKPWEDNDIKFSVIRALEQKYLEQERRRLEALTIKQNNELQELNEGLEDTVRARTAEIEQIAAMLQKSNDTLKDYYQSTVEVFSSLSETRFGGMSGHTRRIAELCDQIAAGTDMVDFERENLRFAALLHNLGKLTLPDVILQKSFEELTAGERTAVMESPVLGAAFLMSLEPLKGAASLIRSQCERYDGRGYPDGLKGEMIPLGARILALAKGVVELQSSGSKGQSLTECQIKDRIMASRGRHYDAGVVDIYLRLSGDDGSVVEKEVIVVGDDLQPGMVVSRDVQTKSGVLLLAKGHIIDESLINKIKDLSKNTKTKYFLHIKQM